MTSSDPFGASKVVRAVFATGTVVFFAVGLLVRDDPRWFAAAGTLGLVWWAWDLLLEYVFLPLSDWFFGLLTGQSVCEPTDDLRPTMDDTIRLLESHLQHGASEQVSVNAAIRLEEIYRTVKKDPKRAQKVVQSVRNQYPEAPEWERFDKLDNSDEECAEIE